MPEPSGKYRESLLQWVWETQQFSHDGLKTVGGDGVSIEDPGLLNQGAGPDFVHARLKIGEMLWCGGVEIHNSEKEWFLHKHHTDSNYNQVILHVYLGSGNKPAQTEDRFIPFSLDLTPYLEKPLFRLLLQKQQGTSLACSGNITSISPGVFEKQLQKAQQEYFEYKVNQIVKNYPSGQKISLAWLHALIVSIYDTLGVPVNRSAMVSLAQSMLDREIAAKHPDDFISRAVEIADIRNNPDWKHAGMRPAGRPVIRIRQAAALHFTIHYKSTLSGVIDKGASIWDNWIDSTNARYLPGKQMQSILFATVFLPGLYLLGDLLQAGKLKEESALLWQNFDTNLPDGIVKPFMQAGLPIKDYKRKLGLVHQLKRYCQMRNCHRCELFKKSFHS